jgi:hypothetical protein
MPGFDQDANKGPSNKGKSKEPGIGTFIFRISANSVAIHLKIMFPYRQFHACRFEAVKMIYLLQLFLSIAGGLFFTSPEGEMAKVNAHELFITRCCGRILLHYRHPHKPYKKPSIECKIAPIL